MTSEISKVKELAEKAGIRCEYEPIMIGGADHGHYKLWLKCGNEERDVTFRTESRAEALRKSKFYELTMFEDVVAVANLERGYIEAEIDVHGERLSFYCRALGITNIDGSMYGEYADITDIPEFHEATGPNGEKLEVGWASDSIRPFLRWTRKAEVPTLKIYLGRKIDYREAVERLDFFSDAVFLQFDMEKDVTLSLVDQYRIMSRSRSLTEEEIREFSLTFPQTKFEKSPMSLYRYAQTSRGMPLLQFLAYYQVVEYYFFSFSKEDAIGRARAELKSPAFNYSRDKDMEGLINSLKSSLKGGVSERDQMRISVGKVVSEYSIREFINSDSDVGGVISKPHKKITRKKVSVSKPDFDFRSEVADLLYDIRCRAVHTKGDFHEDGLDVLLPSDVSLEPSMLSYVKLMKFIAQKTLITKGVFVVDN